MKKFFILLLSIFIIISLYSQNPTPDPGDAGSCWLVPDSYTKNTGDLLKLDIHVNTGTQQLQSFGFDLSFHAGSLDYIGYSVNSSHSVNYVQEWASMGQVSISSMFVYGSSDGPSSDLNVLTLTFMATGAVNPTIRLGINNLLDETAAQIGTPQGDSVQITISGSTTAAPTISTTAVPTPTPYGEETPAPTPMGDLEWGTEFYVYDADSPGNPPIQGALVEVSANTQNAAYTDENGTCELEAWAHDVGYVNVTVSAEGYISFTGSILVLQTENPTEIGLLPEGSDPTPVPGPEPGDVDNNGSIDIVDALRIAQFYVGLDPEPFYPEASDVNCDGVTDIIDALLVAQYYVGLISSFY